MRDFTNWNGHVLRKLMLDGEFPEYNYLIYPDGTHVPHSSKYHAESIFDHVWRVVDEAAKLSKMAKLSEYEHNLLMIAATWHDCGKIFTRREKEMLVCNTCNAVYSSSHYGRCKTLYCKSTHYTPKTFMGYHDHEKVGASDWLWGNIAKREGFPSDISFQVKKLIANHLHVMNAIRKSHDYAYNKVSVLLSWADDKGRDAPKGAPDYTMAFRELYEHVSSLER